MFIKFIIYSLEKLNLGKVDRLSIESFLVGGNKLNEICIHKLYLNNEQNNELVSIIEINLL